MRWFPLERRQANWLFAAAAALTYVGLLVAGRHGTFRQDEWAFISVPPTGLASYLQPHNEHWSTVPKAIYWLLLELIGLRSYLPYLAVLLIGHVAAAGGAYALIARRLPPLAALVAVAPLLLIGSGWENLLWAFQIGFVGSVAAGIWALVALESSRRAAGAIAAALLVVAMACSTIGLFFLVAAFVRLLVDPALRRHLAWLAIPALAFGAWYLAFGRGAVGRDLAAPLSAMVFAAQGLAYAIGRFTGFDLGGRAFWLGALVGAGMAMALAMGLAWLAIHRRTPPLAVAGGLGALAMYGLIGLARADYPGDFWNRSRYVYVAAFLLIPAAADILRAIWQPRRSPVSILLVGGLGVALALGSSLVDLRAGRATLNAQAELARAIFEVAETHRGASWLDPRGLPYDWPDFDAINMVMDRYGSPRHDLFIPANAPEPSDEARDRAAIGLSSSSFRVDPAAQPSVGRGVPAETTRLRDVDVKPDGDCLLASSPEGGALTLRVPPGAWVEVDTKGVPASASIGRLQPPSGLFVRAIPADPLVYRLSTPDLGEGTPWQIEVRLSASISPVRVCVRSST